MDGDAFDGGHSVHAGRDEGAFGPDATGNDADGEDVFPVGDWFGCFGVVDRVDAPAIVEIGFGVGRVIVGIEISIPWSGWAWESGCEPRVGGAAGEKCNAH